MTPADPSPSDQAAMWSSTGASAWVATEALMDGLFAPLERALAEAVGQQPGARVLDVGCGTGATTVAAATATGSNGSALGVDVAGGMVDAARARAQRQGSTAQFVVADAQTHPFAPASVDLVISRFGVMFFADPVAAFTNLRTATATGGALELIVWRGPGDNPFMTAAEEVARPLLPGLPVRRTGEPGQWGLGDPDDVRTILGAAGWLDVALEPLDASCEMPADQLETYATKLGPVARALGDADEATRGEVLPLVLDAFAPFVDGDAVRFTAACWTVRAAAR